MNEPTTPLPRVTVPVKCIVAFPIEAPEFRALLIRQGCTLEEKPDCCLIHCPAGTTRTEVYPRTLCERYWVRFPSGLLIKESFDTQRRRSVLFFTPEPLA